jgi:hypothetical protein
MRDCKTPFGYEHHRANELGFVKSEGHTCWDVLSSDCVHCTWMLTSWSHYEGPQMFHLSVPLVVWM